MHPYFSIIIPVYNSERYLQQCLQSVSLQSFKDYQLILVNDGSTDTSLAMCEAYQEIHSNKDIVIVSQSNCGVSMARNAGLDYATGKYIVFLDSDDWLEDNILEYVYNMRDEDIDCFVGMFKSKFETENAIPIFTERMDSSYIDRLSQNEVLRYFHHLRLIMTVWRFIVKREIIVNNGIRFEKGLVHEDEVFAALSVINCESFHLVPFPWYNYRIRDNSITTSKTLYNYECYVMVAMLLLKEAGRFVDEVDEDKRLFLLRCCSENLKLAQAGVDYFGKPLWTVPEGRKFLGLKELM